VAQDKFKCLDCKRFTYVNPGIGDPMCKWCKKQTMMVRLPPPTPDQLKELAHKREVRKLKKCLVELTDSVLVFQDLMEKVMTIKDGFERGKKLALIANALDMVNDSVRHFGLGVSLKSKKKVPKVSELQGYIHWLQQEPR
jgi:hypothetical protein